MTGAARSDCENAENASHALCFGMSGKVREDCAQSYHPSKTPNPMAAKPDSGASGSTGGDAASGASGAAGTGSSGGASGGQK
jgi:hypothetical protein